MRNILAFATIFIALSANAAPPTEESVETLFSLMKTESIMDAMYANVEVVMRQAAKQSDEGKSLTAEQQRVADAMPAKVAAVMRKEFGWDKLEPQYVQIYRDTFSQDEIDGMIAFYRTPVGQAAIDKMPSVMQKSIAVSQTLIQAALPKMMEAMKEVREEAKVEK